MDLSGNKELLNRDLVAFFASRNSPPEALDLSSSWVHKIERAVLDILLSEGCSVIVTLGRSLYRKIPSHLQAAYHDNRVLFISFRGYSRPSFSSSQLRNWATADLATEVVFAPFDRASQLTTLHSLLLLGPSKCFILSNICLVSKKS